MLDEGDTDAEGLNEADALADGEIDPLADMDGLTLLLGLRDGDAEAVGLIEAEGDSDDEGDSDKLASPQTAPMNRR